MNFKVSLIFVGFVINLSNGYWWKKSGKTDNSIEQIKPIDGVTYNRNQTTRLSPEDIFNLHHAFTFRKYLWEDGQVIYKIDDTFNGTERNYIYRGMEEIQDCSCIRFVPVNESHHKHFVKISKDFDNPYKAQSKAGCLHTGQQDILFGSAHINSRSYRSTILHELLHTLGFLHHHSRSDRDNHIEFHMENTNLSVSDIELNYVKLIDPDSNVTFLAPFDVDSIMLYDGHGHSMNGKAVITSKIEGTIIPHRYNKLTLSESDKILINIFYNCTEKLKSFMKTGLEFLD